MTIAAEDWQMGFAGDGWFRGRRVRMCADRVQAGATVAESAI
jgi:hypothetical protein